MSVTGEGDGRYVKYPIEQLLERLELKLDRIDAKLDNEIDALGRRVAALETERIGPRLQSIEDQERWKTRQMMLAFTGLIVEAIVIALALAGKVS